jgi:hypothetical protein
MAIYLYDWGCMRLCAHGHMDTWNMGCSRAGMAAGDYIVDGYAYPDSYKTTAMARMQMAVCARAWRAGS